MTDLHPLFLCPLLFIRIGHRGDDVQFSDNGSLHPL